MDRFWWASWTSNPVTGRNVRGGFDSHALPPIRFLGPLKEENMFGVGMPELIVILVIILIIFGAGKLPQIGEGLGRGIRNFKKATTKEQEEDGSAKKLDEKKPEEK